MTCCDHDCPAPNTDTRYRQILWAALGVNVAMFFVEIVASFIAGSVSLRADALDFLGDAANYAGGRRSFAAVAGGGPPPPKARGWGLLPPCGPPRPPHHQRP